MITHADEEGKDSVVMGGCFDEGCAVGGGEAFRGAPACVLPGAVDAVESFGTRGVRGP